MSTDTTGISQKFQRPYDFFTISYSACGFSSDAASGNVSAAQN